MTAVAVFLCVFCQLCVVGSQLLFKHAMSPGRPQTGGKTAVLLTGGVVLQSAWFFLWTNLLSRWNLSQMYPFEGLNPAILAILAWLVLKDRPTIQGGIGIGLICAGIALAAGS